MISVDIITPSSGHEGCLDCCRKRVESQGDYRWLVEIGDDWLANVEQLIRRSEADAVAIFDDDDYYAPGWVDWIADALENAQLAGQYLRRMYHLPAAAYRLLPGAHGPLPGTMAFRRDTFDDALELLAAGESVKGLFDDLRKTRAILNGDQIVGLKGIGGRKFLSVKHEYTEGRFPKPDPDRSILRKWLGEAAAEYLELL